MHDTCCLQSPLSIKGQILLKDASHFNWIKRPSSFIWEQMQIKWLWILQLILRHDITRINNFCSIPIRFHSCVLQLLVSIAVTRPWHSTAVWYRSRVFIQYEEVFHQLEKPYQGTGKMQWIESRWFDESVINVSSQGLLSRPDHAVGNRRANHGQNPLQKGYHLVTAAQGEFRRS